jgi:TRAP-type mannitol/chloroaromatic compound transport system permease small subunit
MTWYLYGYAWLIGISYVIVVDEHVRVDLLHESLSREKQVWIETLGILFMLIPMILVILIHGLDFGLSSFRDGEGSQQIGLDFVWIIKFSIPLTMVFTLLAALSRLIKCFRWIHLKTNTRLHPVLIGVQLTALFYSAFIVYLMYEWSLDMETMAIFQIFGL